MSAFVRTVLGDVDPETLGPTSGHDHLLVFPSACSDLPERILLDDYDRTREEVLRFRRRGGGGVVELSPFGAGRHPLYLEKLSVETGIRIVASTGFHKAGFYRDAFWAFGASTAQIADLFTGEIEQGMFEFDPLDPFARRSGVRAGAIKIATDENGLTEYYRRVFDAGALAHARTGAPIFTHTELSKGGLEQADHLIGLGVRASSVVIGHMDRVIDLAANLEIAGRGVFLAYDTIARFKYHSDEEEADLIEAMVKEGFGDRILLGMDSTKGRFLSYGGEFGLDYIVRDFCGLLRKRGISREQVRSMLVENPRAALTMRAA